MVETETLKKHNEHVLSCILSVGITTPNDFELHFEDVDYIYCHTCNKIVYEIENFDPNTKRCAVRGTWEHK